MRRPKHPKVKLSEDHVRLVKYLAGARARRCDLPIGIEVDDLVSWGTLGLLRARDRFDPRKGKPFQHFALVCIRGAILDGIRDYCGGRWKPEPSQSDLSFDDEHAKFPRSRVTLEAAERALDAERAMRVLHDSLRYVIRRRFFADRTQGEVAAEMGRSVRWVCQLEATAMALMRDQFAGASSTTQT